MPQHDNLFESLSDAPTISALIGQSEHLYLECKTWSTEQESQKNLAKALCGFANAAGGVLIIGLSTTTSQDKYSPDVIDKKTPVADAAALKSRVEGLIPDIVEPPLIEVTVKAIEELPGQKAGYIVLNVPSTDGGPHRSRKDWRFYLRINTGTYLMEYFQLQDMFGKRQRPILEVVLDQTRTMRDGADDVRNFRLSIKNSGRGIGRFPTLSVHNQAGFQISAYGIDRSGNTGLPRQASDPELFVFTGGADHVIHPRMTLPVATFNQSRIYSGMRGDYVSVYNCFSDITVTGILAAEGIETKSFSLSLPPDPLTIP
jgi:Putative DNA-binding domain